MTEPGHPDDGEFDAHHQLQGALIDAYEAALLDGATRQLAADTLGHLVDFTAVHFAEEERFMTAQACPLLEPHRVAHGHLLQQLRALEGAARVASQEEALAGVERLRGWLLVHVQGPDRALTTWTAERGREVPPARQGAPP
jgi:hemerythrin-like metal-binding protein